MDFRIFRGGIRLNDIQTLNKEIVKAARSYLGVPYRHQGRSRRGLDCVGLVLNVLNDVGIQIDEKDRRYSTWPVDNRLEMTLEELFVPVSSPKVGNLLLFKFFKLRPYHSGIAGDYPHGGLSIIHVTASYGKVVEHSMTDKWKRMLVKGYDACRVEQAL